MKKKISIITVCLNSESYIGDLLESVQFEKGLDTEFIIIDGRSQDSTVSIIQNYSKIVDLFISEADGGIYEAMNKGARLASGEYLWFVNSDDRILPGSIKHIDNALVCNPPGLSFGLQVCDESFNVIRETFSKRWKLRYLFTTPYKHPGFLVRAQIFREIGYFDSSFRSAADYDFMCKYQKQYDAQTKFVRKCVTQFRRVGLTGRDNKVTNPHELINVLCNTGLPRWLALLILQIRIQYKALNTFYTRRLKILRR